MSKPNLLSLSTHYLRMISSGSTEVMASGTGFIYDFNSTFYLITNGHNVTRVNPENGRRIIDSIAFPAEIKTRVRSVTADNPNMMGLIPITIALYYDKELTKPTWLVHPEYGYRVDVIAIPFMRYMHTPEHLKFFPINKFAFDDSYELEVADDVFILGYPFDITGSKELPIWKRGSIATEPSIDLAGLPKFLVDTATRPGMSGSPVIMLRHGVPGFKHEKPPGKELIGQLQLFAGIYSGRIGSENNLQAQLGIVWKPRVIEEILLGGKSGSLEFQNI